MSGYSRIPVLFCLLARLCSHAGETNGLHTGLSDPALSWGSETNQIRAGILTVGTGQETQVVVFILSSETNPGLKYVTPPLFKFPKLELVDEQGNGALLTAHGSNLVGSLPAQILPGDLPRVANDHTGGRSRNGMITNWVMTASGAPHQFARISLNDVFVMKPERHYTLTICPAIYEFTKDRKRLLRIDLPCVSKKL